MTCMNSEHPDQHAGNSASYRQLLNKELYSEIDSQEKQHGLHLASENDWWEVVYNSGLRATVDWMDVNVIYTQAKKI